MLSFLRGGCANRIILFTLLAAFTLNTLNSIEFNFNEVAFLARIERLVDKLINSQGKSADKMINCAMDIKSEIETSYNVKIDINQYIDRLSSEIKKTGNKVPKKELEAIKKKIKKADKRHKTHLEYIEMVMHDDNYQLNDLDERMIHETKHSKKEEEEEEEEIILPSQLVWGVTITLVGFFLAFVPIPICKEWSPRLITMGVGACANSICSKKDENNKDKK